MAKHAAENESPKKYRPWELKKHDAEILEMRLGGATLQAIADRFATTKESIRNAVARQLLENAKRKPSLPPAEGEAA